MQKKDQMHPDDKRNLFLFAVISIVLWLSYDHFILKPKMDAMREAQTAKEEMVVKAQSSGAMSEEGERDRAEIISETNNVRVEIKNDNVFGTINLTGARIDDLGLKNYFETVEREDNVHVLSPAGSIHPKYIEDGWVVSDANIKVPNAKTVWTKTGGDVLTPSNPIALEWNNGQGLTFQKVISINKDYAFTVVNRVINRTQNPVTLYPFSLIAERGIPEEYLGRFIIHEGPMGYFNDELYEAGYTKMEDEPSYTHKATKGWVALTSKNWLTAIVPAQGDETKYRITYTKAAKETVKDRYQVDSLGKAVTAAAGGMAEAKTNFFAGAKKLELLGKYEKEWGIPHFDLAVDFGWFYFLTKPFFYIINFFYGIVGNFGLAIILFTVVLRICVFPLANTSFKSFAKMRQIGPKMGELRDKYADDKPRLQKELVSLYQKEKVNPMAGCLPILVQIPIFFSLFKVLSNSIEMRHAPFFGWIQDLSAPDPTSIFNLFGLLPFTPPQFLMIGIWPCLMLVTMIIQRKLSPPPTDKLQAQMIAAMPWIMTFILAQFAAGLVIYWTFNNLFSTLQQYIIMRRMGVEVDLLGNMLGKKKESTPIEGVNAEAGKVEVDIEDALGVDQADTPENDLKKKQVISKPKPKKKVSGKKTTKKKSAKKSTKKSAKKSPKKK